MTYIGIDPGKSGALALISGSVVKVFPFDRQVYTRELKSLEGGKICVLEHVNAMPGQGVTSMFSFGENFGWLQGMLDTLEIPYQLIRPQRWKKEYGLGKTKEDSITVCKRLFPDVVLRRTDMCRKDDDNMAEAVLMAEYGRRKL